MSSQGRNGVPAADGLELSVAVELCRGSTELLKTDSEGLGGLISLNCRTLTPGQCILIDNRHFKKYASCPVCGQIFCSSVDRKKIA